MNYDNDQPYKQNVEDVKDEDPCESTSDVNLRLFKQALLEASEKIISRIEEEISDIEIPPPSRRHKIRMNRLFRERVGSTLLTFPEKDSLYERLRSKIVVKLKINEHLDRRKQRRRRR